MKKLYAVLLFFICVTGVLFFAPKTAYANTTQTLQPGWVYTFTGLDARVISHVNVTGVGRYQYMAVDGNGEVVSYGFSFGRASVLGDGFIRISPLAEMTVSFDASRLVMTATAGVVLREINISGGQNFSLTSLISGQVVSVRTNENVSFTTIVTDSAGQIISTNRDVRQGQINIAPLTTVTITPLRGSLQIYFPAEWEGRRVSSINNAQAVITSHTLRAGSVYQLLNNGTQAVTVQVEPATGTATFAYSFIIRDRQGHVINHGDATGNSITLQPGRAIFITPRMNGVVTVPSTINAQINISPGTVTPAYRVLSVGQSMTITNHDLTWAYNVYLASYPAGDPIVYDFTVEGTTGIRFGAQVTQNSISIPPGESVTITVGRPPAWAPQEMAVRFPENEHITYTLASPTVAHQNLEARNSLVFANLSTDVFTLITRGTGEFDYAVTGLYGEVPSFGRQNAGHTITLNPGEEIIMSRVEANPVTVHFPLAWLRGGLIQETNNTPALTRFTLLTGESLLLENANQREHKSLRVHREAFARTASFDYVHSGFYEEVISFGRRLTGDALTLNPEDRLHLTNPEAQPLQLLFPTVLLQRGLLTATTTETALYRHLLAPGQSLLLENSHRFNDMFIQATREPHLRATPFDYVLSDVLGEVQDFGQHQTGDTLILEPGERLHLTADTTPVELLFPAILTYQGLNMAQTTNPALIRHTIQPGAALRIDNTNARLHKQLRVENPLNTRGIQYEFVSTDNRNIVLTYGINPPGKHILRYSSRFSLAPTGNQALTVSYPAIWHNAALRLHTAEAPLLYTVTLRPGERLTLRNNTNNDMTLSNNSSPGWAGFFTRTGEVNFSQPTDETAEHGPIHIPRHTTLTLLAARGADLQIWMPLSRARQMRLL